MDHLIDPYAYANRGRAVDPAEKAGLALIVLCLCLVLDRPAVGLLAAIYMWAMATLWAGLPSAVFGRLLLAQGSFLIVGVLGVVLSIGTTPPDTFLWRWQAGPLWVSSGPAAADTALHLVTRALGSAAALNFLALTTPLVDLIDLMRRMHMPVVVIDLMTLIYRFLFILLESLERIHTAQDSRLGYTGIRRSMSSAALLASRLFIEAYQRSQRLDIALQSRGFTGELKVLPTEYRGGQQLWWLGAAIIVSLLLVRAML